MFHQWNSDFDPKKLSMVEDETKFSGGDIPDLRRQNQQYRMPNNNKECLSTPTVDPERFHP